MRQQIGSIRSNPITYKQMKDQFFLRCVIHTLNSGVSPKANSTSIGEYGRARQAAHKKFSERKTLKELEKKSARESL